MKKGGSNNGPNDPGEFLFGPEETQGAPPIDDTVADPVTEAGEAPAPALPSTERHQEILPDSCPVMAGHEIWRTDGPLKRLVDFNFLEYASYVIRDRAIPDVEDGLKPVQRRILYSLHENDDGKFIKVANIVGYCMQYHPHGDASIADALVTLANKDFFIDRQGNFGNLYTGDPAAASRYIECRLTDLARSQLFNKHLTQFVPSYDGRRQEPVTLPAKVPVLLMQGAEGIAVGLSTRILPHNFAELLQAQIAILKKQPFEFFPDFQQGGLMDASEYDKGRGKVRIRAEIEKKDDATLIIREIPFGTTTDSLISSIEDATRKRKLKIKSIQDYTGEKVEIHIHIAQGGTADQVRQALYAFSQCEVQVTSNVLVIYRGRPVEMTVDEVLRLNTESLRDILRRELEWEINRLLDEFHNKTLVQIFIENRIYKDIEECTTYDAVNKAVFDGVNRFRHLLRRDIVQDDVEMLLQVRIKRISLFDMQQNRRELDDILIALDEAEKNLAQITKYTVRYLEALYKQVAKSRPRRTRITSFQSVEVRELTATELTIRYDRENGFLGHDLKAGDELFRCSSLDKIILCWEDGRYQLLPPPSKLFVDTTLMHCAVFDRERVYTGVYSSGPSLFIKRFKFGGTIMNREYRSLPDEKDAKYFVFEPGTPEHIYVKFKPAKFQRVHQLMFEPSTVAIKNVKARGQQLTMKRVTSVGTKKPRNWEDSNVDPDAGVMDF